MGARVGSWVGSMLLCGALVGLWVPGAAATPVAFSFSATITDVTDNAALLGGTIGNGTTLTGSYTFELSTPDSNFVAEVGLYENAIVDSITLSAGGNTLFFDLSAATLNRIQIQDGVLRPVTSERADSYSAQLSSASWSLNGSARAEDARFQILLEERDTANPTVLSTPALSAIPPVVSGFTQDRDLRVRVFSTGTSPELLLSLNGTMNAIVPEPSTALLLGGGLMALAAARRRV